MFIQDFDLTWEDVSATYLRALTRNLPSMTHLNISIPLGNRTLHLHDILGQKNRDGRGISI